MFRKLSLALAVSAALSPVVVQALGLGDISTKSALNERFEAEIALIAVDAGEIDSIKAELASPLDFARAGIERPYLLSRLSFQPSILKDGRSVIKVITKDSIREPFLNFLVEVNWPNGRLIREYTVLLDPPVTIERKPPPILAASSASSLQDLRPTGRQAAQVSGGAGTAEVYRVRAGDTLWKIASQQRVAGASNEQMMMALFEQNPRAFMGGDINRLKAGALLDLPDQTAVLGLSRKDARDAFRAAQQGAAKARPKAKPPVQSAERLQIATLRPVKQKADPGQAMTAPIGKDIEQVKSDLIVVRETSESTRQDTEELRSRIRELEAQLTDIRELLKLKSDQLAQIQTADRDVTAATQTLEAEQAPALSVEPQTSLEQASPSAIQAPEQPESVERSPTSPTQVESEPLQTAGPAALAEVRPPVQQPTPVKPAPITEAEPVKQPGLIDQFMSNSTLIGVAGGIGVILLSLLWLLLRRRREAENEFQESVLLSPELDASSAQFDADLAKAQAKSADKTDETSFISDFSPSDIDALQEETGEVDPSAEADVYIAYGRYQQAESLVKQAIEKSPERLDLQLKLLEIYFTTRDETAFVQLAEQLHEKGVANSDPHLWERVQTMGQELEPDHALFAGAKVAGGAAAVAALEQQSTNQLDVSVDSLGDLGDLDLDLETELSEFPEETSSISGLDDGSVIEPPDLDLSALEKANAPRAGSASSGDVTLPGGQAALEESEFSLSLDDLGSLEDIDLGDLDIDQDQTLDDRKARQGQTPPDRSSKRDSSVSSNLLSSGVEEDDIPSISLDDLEFDESELGDESENASLSGLMDGADHSEEVETKLDLARAYIEMGDGDGAKEILAEVVSEGSEKQKNEARELMEQID